MYSMKIENKIEINYQTINILSLSESLLTNLEINIIYQENCKQISQNYPDNTFILQRRRVKSFLAKNLFCSAKIFVMICFFTNNNL